MWIERALSLCWLSINYIYNKRDDWKTFPSPQSSPKPKACRASYDAIPVRLLAHPNTPVVRWDFLGLPEANPCVRLHFKKNRYSYLNLKHETSIRIVFFLHLVSTNRCKRLSGDLFPPLCEVTLLALFLKNKALQLGLKCHIFCN